MLIDIKLPIFKCSNDEGIFFCRVAALTLKTSSHPNKPHYLRVETNLDNEETLNKLSDICEYWDAKFFIIHDL